MDYLKTCVDLLAVDDEIELSEWEWEFLANIVSNYTDNDKLSIKQKDKIEQIGGKYAEFI